MSDKRNLFEVYNKSSLGPLAKWLQGRRYGAVIFGLKDRRGMTMVGLKQDGSNRGLVVVIDDSVYDQAVDIIEEHRAA